FAAQVGDTRTQQSVGERLVALRPNEPLLRLALASAYFQGSRPALALRTFHTFLDRWPNHPDADKVRQTLAAAEPDFRRHLQEKGLGGPDEMELGVLHEEVQLQLERGKYAEARRLADQLLCARPQFTPALNN